MIPIVSASHALTPSNPSLSSPVASPTLHLYSTPFGLVSINNVLHNSIQALFNSASTGTIG